MNTSKLFSTDLVQLLLMASIFSVEKQCSINTAGYNQEFATLSRQWDELIFLTSKRRTYK
jgi:hypothetical protein